MYTKLQIALIVTALATTAALPATQQPVPDSPGVSAGETLFFGKAGCGACHEINGRGGVMGPDLSAAGNRPPQELQTKILNPNSSGSTVPGRGPSTIVAKTKGGTEIQGVRRNEDTFTLQVV